MTMKIAVLLSVPLFSASVFAAATTQSSNTFGLLRVDSAQAQTIVCVPWVGSSASATDRKIPVTDIVKTANLTPSDGSYDGDELHWYDPSAGSYKSWHLVPGESGAAPVWEATTTVSETGADSGTSAAGTALARGDAFILVRKSPTDDKGGAKPFYLLGQVAKFSEAVANKLSAGAYSLLAPPSVAGGTFDLNNATWVTPDAKDAIIIPGANVTLGWNESEEKWGTYKMVFKNGEEKEIWNYNVAKVPAGCGAWYVSKGKNVVTVTWPK